MRLCRLGSVAIFSPGGNSSARCLPAYSLTRSMLSGVYQVTGASSATAARLRTIATQRARPASIGSWWANTTCMRPLEPRPQARSTRSVDEKDRQVRFYSGRKGARLGRRISKGIMADIATTQHPRYSERKETHRKIGELLVEAGKLRRDQLEHALRMQQTMGGLIGSVLVELGLIADADLTETLAKSLGLEMIDLNRIGVVDPDAAHFIPETIARRHKLIGVRFEKSKPERRSPDRVVVAM